MVVGLAVRSAAQKGILWVEMMAAVSALLMAVQKGICWVARTVGSLAPNLVGQLVAGLAAWWAVYLAPWMVVQMADQSGRKPVELMAAWRAEMMVARLVVKTADQTAPLLAVEMVDQSVCPTVDPKAVSSVDY